MSLLSAPGRPSLSALASFMGPLLLVGESAEGFPSRGAQYKRITMFYTKPWLDAAIILLVVLLFVGPKRLPTLGKSLGHGMREFKDAITGKSQPDDADRAELEAGESEKTAASRSTGSASSGAESG